MKINKLKNIFYVQIVQEVLIDEVILTIVPQSL